MTTIRIDCRDPVVSRDGRPFGENQGNKMRSLVWPLPSVVAGSLRTAVGKAANEEFTDNTSKDLFQLAVAGVFPVVDDKTLYLPAPNDCVVEECAEPKQTIIHCAKPSPMKAGEGCDLPIKLDPVLLDSDKDFKPKPAPAWWPVDEYVKWLLGDSIVFDNRFLKSPEVEERTHVVMDSKTGAGKEGQLFSTAALPLTHLPRYESKDGKYMPIRLTARVVAEGWCETEVLKLDTLHPLGGERRLVHWKKEDSDALWEAPKDLKDALKKNPQHIRMVLATPAIFAEGWKPGWLKEGLSGEVPGTGVKLELVGFTIQRWKAISGWSYQSQPGFNGPGPKPVRRMVPAGGVYFFKASPGTTAPLAERWLQSVCDGEQDRRDGFGLACWGTWEPKENV